MLIQSKYKPFFGGENEHLTKHMFYNIAQFLRKMSSVSHQNIFKCIYFFREIDILKKFCLFGVLSLVAL